MSSGENASQKLKRLLPQEARTGSEGHEPPRDAKILAVPEVEHEEELKHG